VPSRVFDQHNSPNTNHSMMEKSHLSENYFSLARKHEEMEDRLEEMLKKIEIEEYITRSSLKHVRYRLREQLVNSYTDIAFSSMINLTSSRWKPSFPTQIPCSQTISCASNFLTGTGK